MQMIKEVEKKKISLLKVVAYILTLCGLLYFYTFIFWSTKFYEKFDCVDTTMGWISNICSGYRALPCSITILNSCFLHLSIFSVLFPYDWSFTVSIL